MEYRCCGGSFCCCTTPVMPKVPCLCLEASFCTNIAILANRDMTMSLYRMKFDPYDEYLITCSLVLDCVISIAQIFYDVPEEVKDIVDLIVCLVMGCSLAQQASELDAQLN